MECCCRATGQCVVSSSWASAQKRHLLQYDRFVITGTVCRHWSPTKNAGCEHWNGAKWTGVLMCKKGSDFLRSYACDKVRMIIATERLIVIRERDHKYALRDTYAFILGKSLCISNDIYRPMLLAIP